MATTKKRPNTPELTLRIFADKDSVWKIEATWPQLNPGKAENPVYLPALYDAARLLPGQAKLLEKLRKPDSYSKYPELNTDLLPGIPERFLFEALLYSPWYTGVSQLYYLFEQYYYVATPGSPEKPRIVLKIEVEELANLPWEKAFYYWRPYKFYPGATILRKTVGRALVASQPLKLPLGVVQLDFPQSKLSVENASQQVSIPDIFKKTFGDYQNEEREAEMRGVYAVERLDPAKPRELRDALQSQVGILHLTGFEAGPFDGSGLSLTQDSRATLGGQNILKEFDWLLGLEKPVEFSPSDNHPGDNHPAPPRPDLSGSDLLAFCEAAGVRLLVLQTASGDYDSYLACLKLAQQLSINGGPGILVFYSEENRWTKPYFEGFYRDIIHDVPLHLAYGNAQYNFSDVVQAALITGEGDENLLRISRLELTARRLRKNFEKKYEKAHINFENLPDLIIPGLESLGDKTATRDRLIDTHGILGDIHISLQGNWITDWRLEWQSSVPFTRNIWKTRQGLNLLLGFNELIKKFVGPEETPQPLARYTNAWLLDRQTGRKIKPNSVIWPQKTYQLHIDIGPKSRQSVIERAVQIPPEVLAPLDAEGGDYLLVAVYSQDFDLAEATPIDRESSTISSVMKRVWLPVGGGTESLYFTLKPLRSGLVFARICVYYGNQLLQSLRLDARVGSRLSVGLAQLPDITQEQLRLLRRNDLNELADLSRYSIAELAAMAEIDSRQAHEWLRLSRAIAQTSGDLLLEIPGLGQIGSARLRQVMPADFTDLLEKSAAEIAKLAEVSLEQARKWLEAAHTWQRPGYRIGTEYTVSANLGDVRNLPGRTISIFTNKVNDRMAVGVKGNTENVTGIADDDWTAAKAPGEQKVSEILAGVRDQLEEISTLNGGYRFYSDNIPELDPPIVANGGSDTYLEIALAKLAYYGSDIYHEIFDAESRKKLKETLDQPGQRIHIARVTDTEILPWAFVYNYDIDTSQEVDQKMPTVCLEGLKNLDKDGKIHPKACGKAGVCHVWDAGYRDVVCPWGFWGYRHILEQPAQLVTGEARDLVVKIPVDQTPRMLMNVNSLLQRLDPHHVNLSGLPQLRQTFNYAGDDRTGGKNPKMEVMEALSKQNLDLIYFYCHAGTMQLRNTEKAYLSVGSTNNYLIVKSDLNSIGDAFKSKFLWENRPLVFINGCKSAALTPNLMGNLIDSLAELGAAGVIGTEVRVWEQMATVVAEKFFSEFLKGGKDVGEILRDIRLELLKIYNPLGLIYTNYCSSNLELVIDNSL